MKKLLLIIIVIIVVVGGGAFYGGMKYEQNVNAQTIAAQRTQRAANFGGAGQKPDQRTAGDAGGFIGGQIISKDAQSITVKSSDGSSKIVFFSDTTKIMKSAEGSPSDFATGKQVSVNGKTNQNGSITAETIQLRQATSTPK